MKLTKEKNKSKEFAFEGIKNILIVGGLGKVVLERKLGASGFYPLSLDTNGTIAEFNLNGECAYNGTLEEKGLEAKYRFVADLDSGEVEITVTKVNR